MNVNLLTNTQNYYQAFTGVKKDISELEQKITSLNAMGKSDREASEILGYSYSYVAAIRKRLGLPAQMVPIQKEQIEAAVNARKQDKVAAKDLGVSTYWYKQLKSKYGFTRILPEINEDEVKQMVLQDKTDKEISEYFGGGRLRRIAEIRKSIGKKHKFVRKGTDIAILEKVKVLTSEGKTIKEIAQAIQKSISWTSILCKKISQIKG